MTNTPFETPTEGCVQDCCESAVEKVGCAMTKWKDFVRENPIPLILGALGIGFAFALLLPRAERSRRERYVDDPLDELKELLRATGRRVGHSAEETCDNTASAIEKSLKNLKNSLPSFFRP